MNRLRACVCVLALSCVGVPGSLSTAAFAAGSSPYLGTPAAIPGTIHAENFDNGGEGVGYHDASVGNAGGQYRQTDVDIALDGATGTYVVGWVSAGEWLNYTVNVAAAGTYSVAFRVASLAQGGAFHLEMNGVNVTGALTVPDTGGWFAWRTINATVTLSAGIQIAKLVMDTTGVNAVGNFSTIQFAAAPTSSGTLTPFLGSPAPIPGRVEAAQFDNGGEGVAYHDENAGNTGGAYRQTDVDLAASSEGGYTIGWIGAGEWVNYTVNVARSGSYTVQLRVASPSGGGSLHIGFNGSSGSWTQVGVPATGGWQTWTSVNVPLTLSAGIQQITLLFDTQGYNVSYLTVVDNSAGSGGSVINVPAGGDLQAAINAAQGGDTILLAPGATYTGAYVLSNKPGSSYVTIRSGAAASSLPPDGSRVVPDTAGQFARIQGGVSAQPAFMTAPGAHHYRLQFLEIYSAASVGTVVQLGDSGPNQTTLSAVPHDLVIDRCYIHGAAAGGQRRGVALNSAATTISNSYISDFKSTSVESQAVAGWNGPGPFTIVNNYLEASAEGVMFGGGDPSIVNLVPSDITIRGNTIARPVAWQSQGWIVKNLLELKNAQRVAIDGNVFENHWVAAQSGFAILFTPRNQDGGSPWSVVQQIQFTNNVVRRVAAGINILGTDDIHPSQPTNTIVIRNNLFEISASAWGGNGRVFQLLGGRDVTIDHNTVFTDGSSVVFGDGLKTTGLSFVNNIVPDNAYAVIGTGTGPGSATIAFYFPQSVWVDNVFAAGRPATYPSGNYYPASLGDVGFVNLSGGNYRLAPSSPFKRAATDGTDVGADIDAVNRAAGTSY